MGHCEMGLAVAGLKENEIFDREKMLASGNWSSLPVGHQMALRFARKQALEPWKVSQADLEGLEKEFGREGMWQVVWWSGRCHFMTRVADAFQLPLEKDNVFQDEPAKKP
ncbi:MAG: hypothetical protein DWH82_11070 [Planctomycetota bacterium]|nr:MAG: hypothetical protein DWH82_11070 [Planctomycetota bacterium]